MDKKELWSAFLETGAPEYYLLVWVRVEPDI